MKAACRQPRVSIVMSVYNGGEFLAEAIESILSQTFGDFEFIIIDDGSTDSSEKIIKDFDDPRVRLISRGNKGLTYSLNEGLKLARGGYIARQDADDISLPTRLEKEVTYLDSHPDVGLVGTNYIVMDETGKELVKTNMFNHPDDLSLALLITNQYGHGSVMFRRDLLPTIKGYDADVGTVEDYDLWIRISCISKIANLEEHLYKWRKVKTSISHSGEEINIREALAIGDKAFGYFLNHRNRYRFFSFNRSGKLYRERKSSLYCNLAYKAKSRKKPLLALHFMLMALMFKPRLKRNYKSLLRVLKPGIGNWEPEPL